ncbi:phenylalanyl-tRNA synthetase alpha chain [Arthroderma uncinatum]|uniref:phenylalanyl-tRNA synthetase alpha chain n=1 Tax=Arthroderma uncinatum TaxID=74035 RepID=UPI00144AA3A0|nr:phenylalanyl-tRNA synthetase alpha chain [Arthroderma uncinatum]KAF3483902.1 phenylalanyl-tRNA synthetase alpha chain [Arthroderma uncinatum]
MASDLTPQVLECLASTDEPQLSSHVFPSAPAQSVKAALDRLTARDMVLQETIETEEVYLLPEAEGIVANGSHEARVFEAVSAAMEGLKITDLPDIVGKEIAKVGTGNAFKKGWIKKDKDTLRAATDSIEDTSRDQLAIIQKTKTHPDAKILAELRKRKLINTHKVFVYKFWKGPKYAREFVKEETDLTMDMLADGSWKTAKLKGYNFNAKGAITPCGALHPLNKVRHEFRQIFFEMGFKEMPTNRYVESGFWNFDALYVPQQHPARDLQDTFYISDPVKADKPRADPENDIHLSTFNQDKSSPASSTASKPPNYEEYWNNVHAAHETGFRGSIGYRYPWSEEESLRLVLRTHTTAVSAYMLQKLAQDPRPARYFSIDKVFRNETLDATHLAEFQHIEGVIADFGLSLGGLIGFMEVFFGKMGMHGLRFKPAYNPYTEPSLEIFAYHNALKKWVEIGNSGMFRPEMLEPMGIPSNMQVYGWGLSLERPTMIK